MSKALIFGRGRGVWDEMVAARQIGYFDIVIAVGKAACDYPGFLDHWVSFHAELFDKWSARRKELFFPMQGITFWTSRYQGKARAIYANGFKINEVRQEGGSSGLIAVKVAQALGARRIVLAGIPMEESFGHYDEVGAWDEARTHRAIWEKEAHLLQENVRSMSGWTQQRFGSPSKEWLG
jgi:hypothetical protein